MRIKAVGMGFVGEFDREDTVLVEALYFDTPGAMDEGRRIGVCGFLEDDTDVTDLAVLMIEEYQIARLNIVQFGNLPSLRHLFGRIAQTRFAE